jgi:hypothetical protein
MEKLLNKPQINSAEKKYISDFAAICMDLVDRRIESYGEVLYSIITDYFNHLNDYEQGSNEYNYALYCWAVEILEAEMFETQEECYDAFEKYFEMSKEAMPKCIAECIEALGNEQKRKEIYDAGKLRFGW